MRKTHEEPSTTSREIARAPSPSVSRYAALSSCSAWRRRACSAPASKVQRLADRRVAAVAITARAHAESSTNAPRRTRAADVEDTSSRPAGRPRSGRRIASSAVRSLGPTTSSGTRARGRRSWVRARPRDARSGRRASCGPVCGSFREVERRDEVLSHRRRLRRTSARGRVDDRRASTSRGCRWAVDDVLVVERITGPPRAAHHVRERVEVGDDARARTRRARDARGRGRARRLPAGPRSCVRHTPPRS